MSCWTCLLLLSVATPGEAQRKPYSKPDPPEGAAEFRPEIPDEAGQHLALTVTKLEQGFNPDRPFLIWALGSSYTARLGNGEILIPMLQEKFGSDRKFEYKRMVGNACPWQYLRGWARQMVVADQPDLVLINTIGKIDDLEKLLILLRTRTTADIIIPSIHWRERGKPNWEEDLETAPDQDVPALRKLCAKYGVEFVELRREWGRYLKQNSLPIEALLGDAVHQSPYGAWMVNRMIADHIRPRETYAYLPEERENHLKPPAPEKGRIQVEFTGNRIDLVGRGGQGKVRVFIDGKPATEADAFLMTYIQPAKANFTERRSPARDQSPHGVKLGKNVAPQTWTITVLDEKGNFELTGSVTGKDGRGNAFQPFESDSGQILMPPDEWRRAERNKAGDRFTWEVTRAAVGEVDFSKYPAESMFQVRLAQNLTNEKHTLQLRPLTDHHVEIEEFVVFTPPLRE
jgi:hypothetical protein